MAGQIGLSGNGEGASGDPLVTIDNLWKILATEKSLPQPTGATGEKQKNNRSRSRNNDGNGSGSRGHSGSNVNRPCGITINGETERVGNSSYTPISSKHAGRQETDFFATPSTRAQFSDEKLPAMTRMPHGSQQILNKVSRE